jgi:hypothetical protein
VSGLEILGALCGPLLAVALLGFLVVAAKAFEVPKRPRPYSRRQLKALVRREFERPPATDLDEGMRHLAALITKEN